MALNWAMLTPDNSPILLPQEEFVTSVESGAELTLFIPDEPPSRGVTAGGSGGSKKLKGVGGVWLTNQRIVFVAAAIASDTTTTTTPATQPPITSLSVPLSSILTTRFEQPYLGANYLAIEIRPVLDGGLTSGTQAELRFKDRPMFQFISTLEKVRERALYMGRKSLDEEDGLPLYTSPAAESSTSSFVMATPVDQPPMYNA